MKQEVQAAITAALAPTRAESTMTERLLDAAKRAQGIPSNYRLARVLGVSDNTMAKWSQGRNAPGEMYAARLAEMAGMDPGVVVAELNADRATDPDVRVFWKGIAERLRHAGLAAIFGVAIGFGAPSPAARAYTVLEASNSTGETCGYVNLGMQPDSRSSAPAHESPADERRPLTDPSSRPDTAQAS